VEKPNTDTAAVPKASAAGTTPGVLQRESGRRLGVGAGKVDDAFHYLDCFFFETYYLDW
jgi:hypothetical protein